MFFLHAGRSRFTQISERMRPKWRDLQKYQGACSKNEGNLKTKEEGKNGKNKAMWKHCEEGKSGRNEGNQKMKEEGKIGKNEGDLTTLRRGEERPK